MPTLPFFQVDAFAERPFAGNPAAICLVREPLTTDRMQEIAAENNLSETAFIDLSAGAAADPLHLRWFTPTVEVDLCGHATLASGFVLLNEVAPQRTSVRFATRSGVLTVARGAGGAFLMDLPISHPQPIDDGLRERLSTAARLPLRDVVRGATAYFAEVENAAAVRGAAPDLAAVAALGTSLCLTAAGDDGPDAVDFVSRFFAPAHGINEDPVTGSAHCTLAPYWGARLGKTRLRARQVSRRVGELTCEVLDSHVRLGGRCHLVITGQLQA
ncbi:MAG TPA: PhzF family phenazine biosynthesis protein [Polyangia bacterium]|nr:PhzF family phenazine biosynthesis protein [Polyangia bacterium]